MKSFTLGLVALSTFSILSDASAVHISVSDGDVEVDFSTGQESPSNSPKLNTQGKPDNTSTKPILPVQVVNLDYEFHAGNLTETGRYLSFKNIPYAQPPLNEFRWLPPAEVEDVREEVNHGSKNYICPQVNPGWAGKAIEFISGFNNATWDAKWETPINASQYGPIPQQSDLVSEDCLTLDVVVPVSVWEKKEVSKAPVVAWIHGGGFIAGSKDSHGSPEGLLEAAGKSGDDIIFVAMNYRLGAFGWLGGDRFKEQGGLPNLGLHDQNFALAWVKKYIERFGGDSQSVTVMGQSAGASSILHHLTSYGGDQGLGPPDFDAAIIQSPGFFPQANATLDDNTFAAFLALTNSTDLQSLAEKNSSVLIAANANLTWTSPYGYFNFGPTVDDRYVPDLPGRLLKDGRFHSHIPLFLGHEKLDGLLFTPPWIRSNKVFRDEIQQIYPAVPNSTLGFIANNYTIPITSKIVPPQLTVMAVSGILNHIAIACNNYYLTEASLKASSSTPVWRYIFNSLPAVHGYDIGYTFFPNQGPIQPVNETLAHFFQQSIVNFIRDRNPNPEGQAKWDKYESNKRRVMNLGKPLQLLPDYTWESRDDTMLREKCAFWQSSPFYPPLPPPTQPPPPKQPPKEPKEPEFPPNDPSEEPDEPKPRPQPPFEPPFDGEPLPKEPGDEPFPSEPEPEPRPEPGPEPRPYPEEPNPEDDENKLVMQLADYRGLV